MKTCSIIELYKNGRLRRGDFVEYFPDKNTYTTNSENTGCEPQVLTNDTSVNWRVWDVDKESGELLLFPDSSPIGYVAFCGIRGFMKATDELNKICSELGGNKELGAEARCVDINDMNKHFKMIPEDNHIGYAIYPYDVEVRGTEVYKGKKYKRAPHNCEIAKFYVSDGGGREEKDENGFVYRVPEENNPVYVTHACISYEHGNIINQSFLLASTGVCIDSYGEFLSLQCCFGSCIGNMMLYDSGELIERCEDPIRPIVSIKTSLHMDVSDEKFNGGIPHRAWKFAKIV